MPSICLLIFILISIAPWVLGPNFSEGQNAVSWAAPWILTSAEQGSGG